MRQLTEQEEKAQLLGWKSYNRGIFGDGDTYSFEAGFVAGLDYQQPKINALLAHVAGKITRAELEAIVPEVTK